jgi:hypothetical protein
MVALASNPSDSLNSWWAIVTQMINNMRDTYEARVSRVVNWFEIEESRRESLLHLYGHIYDWKSAELQELFPWTSPEVIIRENLSKLLKTFYTGRMQTLGISISYPNTREEMEKDWRFIMGWHQFSEVACKEVYTETRDTRTKWQRIMWYPQSEQKLFSHFAVFQDDSSLLTSAWRQILDQYHKIQWYTNTMEEERAERSDELFRAFRK